LTGVDVPDFGSVAIPGFVSFLVSDFGRRVAQYLLRGPAHLPGLLAGRSRLRPGADRAAQGRGDAPLLPGEIDVPTGGGQSVILPCDGDSLDVHRQVLVGHHASYEGELLGV